MKNLTKSLTLATLAFAIAVPGAAFAQRSEERRRETMSQWQKLGYAGAALGLLGQFSRDKTLSYVGLAGGLYSTYRMEEDRKSRDRDRQLRAEFWSQDSYYRNGHRYQRREVRRNGHTYYKFVRSRHR
jgi:hypothetical protein